MEHIRNFLRGKGFALALAACILAAAAAGVWAVRTIRNQLEEDLGGSQSQNVTGEETYPGIDEGMEQEEYEWEQQTADAAGSVNNVPENTASSPSKPSAGSSGASSGSGSVSEPSALHTESASASSSAAPASAQPVSGRILATFSGDELVYNETLGDWRTHNGVDYACKEDEDVFAPVAGTVTRVGTDGNWGPVVELEDSQGRTWRLCGVGDAEVKEGDRVTAGQKLGEAETIACESAEGDHIHLEVLEGENYLNPAKLLG